MRSTSLTALTLMGLVASALIVAASVGATHASDVDNDHTSMFGPGLQLESSATTDCGIWHNSDDTWSYRARGDATVDADDSLDYNIFFDWKVHGEAVIDGSVNEFDTKKGTDLQPYHHEVDTLVTDRVASKKGGFIFGEGEADQEDARTGGTLFNVFARAYSECDV